MKNRRQFNLGSSLNLMYCEIQRNITGFYIFLFDMVIDIKMVYLI